MKPDQKDYWIYPGGWMRRADPMQPPEDGRAAPWVRWIIGLLVPLAAAGAATNLRWSQAISGEVRELRVRLSQLERDQANAKSERVRELEVRVQILEENLNSCCVRQRR